MCWYCFRHCMEIGARHVGYDHVQNEESGRVVEAIVHLPTCQDGPRCKDITMYVVSCHGTIYIAISAENVDPSTDINHFSSRVSCCNFCVYSIMLRKSRDSWRVQCDVVQLAGCKTKFYLVVTVQCPLRISVNLAVVLKSPSLVGPLNRHPLNDDDSLHITTIADEKAAWNKV